MSRHFASALNIIPEHRSGKNIQFPIPDICYSAFSCFWAMDGSFLQFEIRMEEDNQASNLMKLFGVYKIPTADTMRNVLDFVDPKYFSDVFYDDVEYLIEDHKLDAFKVLDNRYIGIALDGTRTFSSKNIHCDNCNVYKHKN
jgi:hypothetical protein